MLKITGCSDDLIEIDGDIVEEFNCYMHEDEERILALSDGTLLRVNYDNDGIWRFILLIKGNLFDKIIQGEVDQDTFDEVYFKDGMKWIVLGEQKVISKK